MVDTQPETTEKVDDGSNPSTVSRIGIAPKDTREVETVTVVLPRFIVVDNSTIGEITIDLMETPNESIVHNLTYGVRQFTGDGAAQDVHERTLEGDFLLDPDGNKVRREQADIDADKKAGVLARVEAIKTGVFKTGGGGRALSAYDNELRAIVKAVLVNKGMKLADATKAAKTPKAAIIGLALTKAKAMVPVKAPVAGDKEGNKAKVTARKEAVKATAQDLFNTNWKVLTDKATALAAQHKAIDVDL